MTLTPEQIQAILNLGPAKPVAKSDPETETAVLSKAEALQLELGKLIAQASNKQRGL